MVREKIDIPLGWLWQPKNRDSAYFSHVKSFSAQTGKDRCGGDMHPENALAAGSRKPEGDLTAR
jgi:hypothetical protein